MPARRRVPGRVPRPTTQQQPRLLFEVVNNRARRDAQPLGEHDEGHGERRDNLQDLDNELLFTISSLRVGCGSR